MNAEEMSRNASKAKANSGQQENNPTSGNNHGQFLPDDEAPHEEDQPPHKKRKSDSTASTLRDFLAQSSGPRTWDCQADDCGFHTNSEAVLLEHFKTSCPGNPNRSADTGSGLTVKYADHEVILKTRQITNEKDDNK